jgi:methylmalonyl-CoA mutase cobalamin-binding subunit
MAGFLLARRCRVLAGPGRGVVEADVVVDGGSVRLLKPASGGWGSTPIVECDETTIVTPCVYVGWAMPLKLGADTCHRGIVKLMGGDPSGLPFSPDAMRRLASRLARLGVCGAVFSVPPSYSFEMLKALAESTPAPLRFTVAVDSAGGHLSRAVELAERLRAAGLAAGLEVLNGSLAGDDVLREAFTATERLGLRLYIHASYAKREVYESKRRWGLFPVERLHRLGLLTPNTVLVGANWISSWELGYVADAGAAIVYNPGHDMLHCLGGHFPLHEALGRGVRVWFGLGYATASADPWRLLWAGLLLQRYVYWDARIAATHLLEAAVGAAELFSAPKALEDGGGAWLTVRRLDPTYADVGVDVEYGLLRGSETLATVVGGRLVYKGSQQL